MESQRQHIEPVLSDRLVVNLHIVVKSLLVAEMKIVLDAVVYL